MRWCPYEGNIKWCVRCRIKMYQARKHADFLDNVRIGVEIGADLEVEEAGEEEGAAELADKLTDLVGADGDEALVAAVLAVLLLEHDAGDSAGLALPGGYALAGGGPRGGQDRLGVLRVGPREAVEVRQCWRRWLSRGRLRRRRVVVLLDQSEGGAGVGSDMGGLCEQRTVEQHFRESERDG